MRACAISLALVATAYRHLAATLKIISLATMLVLEQRISNDPSFLDVSDALLD